MSRATSAARAPLPVGPIPPQRGFPVEWLPKAKNRNKNDRFWKFPDIGGDRSG